MRLFIRRTFSALLVCLYVTGLLPAPALLPDAGGAAEAAISKAWDGTVADSIPGNGTAGDPYRIETAEQLALLAQDVNSNDKMYASGNGKYFVLVNDIDLGGVHDWTPIGLGTKAFSGSFDGRSHVIRGMKIVSSDYAPEQAGLFGSAAASSMVDTIKNVYLEDIVIDITSSTQKLSVGGVIGTLNDYQGYSAPTGLRASGSVKVSQTHPTCDMEVGGVIGNAYQASLSQCWASMDITVRSERSDHTAAFAGPAFGGVVGRTNADISRAFFVGTIDVKTNAASSVGGIVGLVEPYLRSAAISSSAARCNIKAETEWKAPTDKITGTNIGGIAGRVFIFQGGGSQNELTIKDCFSLGSISGIASNTTSLNHNLARPYVYAGGITGQMCDVSRCWSAMDISASAPAPRLGGAVGSAPEKIEDCYFTGKISHTAPSWYTGTDLPEAGGLAGYLSTNCSVARGWSSGVISVQTGSVGALVGKREGTASVTDSRWLRDASHNQSLELGIGADSGSTAIDQFVHAKSLDNVAFADQASAGTNLPNWDLSNVWCYSELNGRQMPLLKDFFESSPPGTVSRDMVALLPDVIVLRPGERRVMSMLSMGDAVIDPTTATIANTQLGGGASFTANGGTLTVQAQNSALDASADISVNWSIRQGGVDFTQKPKMLAVAIVSEPKPVVPPVPGDPDVPDITIPGHSMVTSVDMTVGGTKETAPIMKLPHPSSMPPGATIAIAPGSSFDVRPPVSAEPGKPYAMPLRVKIAAPSSLGLDTAADDAERIKILNRNYALAFLNTSGDLVWLVGSTDQTPGWQKAFSDDTVEYGSGELFLNCIIFDEGGKKVDSTNVGGKTYMTVNDGRSDGVIDGSVWLVKIHVHTPDKTVGPKSNDNFHWYLCTARSEHEDSKNVPVMREPHTYSDRWIDDGAGNHYQECPVCQKRSTASQHIRVISFDLTQHWRGCVSCDFVARATIEPHSSDSGWNISGDIHWRICDSSAAISKCGQSFDVGSHVPAVALSYDQTEHWQVCVSCDRVDDASKATHSIDSLKWEMSSTHHWHECQDPNCDAKIGLEPHTPNTGDCRVCKYNSYHGAPHDPISIGGRIVYYADTEDHWQVCARGGERMYVRSHDQRSTWESDDTDHWHVCRICETPIASTSGPHVRKLALIDGERHGYRCEVCYRSLSDEAHRYGTWQSDEQYHWHTCACGAEERGAHIFEGGSCTVCGRKSQQTDPSQAPSKYDATDPSVPAGTTPQWVQESTVGMRIRTTIPLSLVRGVRIDKVLLVIGQYTVTAYVPSVQSALRAAAEPYAEIIVHREALSSLSIGSHTMDIIAEDDIATMQFNVTSTTPPPPGPDPDPPSGSGGSGGGCDAAGILALPALAALAVLRRKRGE